MSNSRNIADSAPVINFLDGVTSNVQTQLNAKGTVSNLADLSITSTSTEINKLDAISRGSLIYGNSSAATAILTKGSADQVLTSDGTDIAWADAAGGGGFSNMTTIASSQTWTVPANITLVKIYVTGGGGGSSNGYNMAGSAGGTAIKYLTVVAGNNIVVTIGAGGADGSTGSAGGNTTAVYNSATTITGNGGGGYVMGAGVGGSASGGDLNITGGAASQGTTGFGAMGPGGSFWGSGSHLYSGAYGSGGHSYNNYGSITNGDGKAGVVVIEY